MQRYTLRARAGTLAAVGASARYVVGAYYMEVIFFKLGCIYLCGYTGMGIVENAFAASASGANIAASVTAYAF